MLFNIQLLEEHSGVYEDHEEYSRTVVMSFVGHKNRKYYKFRDGTIICG